MRLATKLDSLTNCPHPIFDVLGETRCSLNLILGKAACVSAFLSGLERKGNKTLDSLTRLGFQRRSPTQLGIAQRSSTAHAMQRPPKEILERRDAKSRAEVLDCPLDDAVGVRGPAHRRSYQASCCLRHRRREGALNPLDVVKERISLQGEKTNKSAHNCK